MIFQKPQRGTGLLALFVDLHEQWHEEFRHWLQEDMFPARLKIGFIQCASYDLVPNNNLTAKKFLTIYEVQSSGFLYSEPYQSLRLHRDSRDTSFHERFIKPERYILSWVGPELFRGEQIFGTILYIDRFGLEPQNIQEFNYWFVNHYISSCVNISDILSVRRFTAVEGDPKEFVVHEMKSESVLCDKKWKRLRADEGWDLTSSKEDWSASYRRQIFSS